MKTKYKIIGICILIFILAIVALQKWPPVNTSAATVEMVSPILDTTPSQKLIVNLDKLDQSLNITDSLASELQKKSL